MTRRELVLAATATALAAQNPQPPQPAESDAPRTPEQELSAAVQRMQQAAAQIDKVPLPMATEPACRFKA